MKKYIATLAFTLVLTATARAQLVNSEWNTGSGDWNVATNWFPNDVPDNGGGITYDVEIGNRPVAVNAFVDFVPEDGTSDTITSLTVSGGADLDTNGNTLFVVGQTTITGAGSSILVNPAVGGGIAFNTDNLDINTSSALQMSGGTLDIDVLLEVNPTGTLVGHGLVIVGDFDGVVEVGLENSASIVVGNDSNAVLTIQANDVDTIDLDGTTETGLVDVTNVSANVGIDTLTLVVDGPLSDAFSGTLTVGQRDTATFNDDFTMDGADVQLSGGTNVATLNGPAAVTSIANSVVTVTGAAVIDNDMAFTGVANTIVMNASSTLTLNGTVTIPDASAIDLTAAGQTLVIGGATTITEAAGDFDWDNATTTVSGTGFLSLVVDQIDLSNDIYNGFLNLNDNGDVAVLVTGTEWSMNGTLTKNNAGISSVNGDRMVVGGTVNVNAGTLDVNASATLAAGTNFIVDAGATADMGSTIVGAGSNLTINGTMSLGIASELAGPATLGGTGLLRLNSTSTVTANTTVNTTSFDWDGVGSGTAHTINDGVAFTVNSTIWDADDTGDVDDNITLGGNGAQIIVNNVPTWTMGRTLTTNTPDIGLSTIGGTSRMILSSALGVFNVNGNTNLDARVTFGTASTTTIGAAGLLTLRGGTDLDFNEMAGGTINGPGLLAADSTKVLRGFGTINANIDFNGDADLVADDGLLDVNGTITDVGTLRTEALGVLDLALALNTSVTDHGIRMSGGTIQGAVITLASHTKGLSGFGIVNNRIVNDGTIQAAGGFLQVETAANDNDWDGAGNTGRLLAQGPSSQLDLRDNALFGFAGTVQVIQDARVFTNGFALDFNPGSSILLDEATYESTNSTDIGGTVTVFADFDGADSTIEVQLNRFLTLESTSSTTLNGNLRLVSNNANIEAGATFSGTGALVIPDNSHLVADANANINVLLDNQGTFRPSGINTVGRVDLKDYQQAATGELIIELAGTGLNQFDRVVVNGAALLAGSLDVDLEGGFVPALGNTFTFLTAAAGRSGTFSGYNLPSIGAVNSLAVAYGTNSVTLQVIAGLWGDYNGNGVVDAADYVVWRNTLGAGVAAFSGADGNGNGLVDQADYDLWRSRFGIVLGAGSGSGAVVPEPATAVLLIMAVAGMCLRRTRSA